MVRREVDTARHEEYREDLHDMVQKLFAGIGCSVIGRFGGQCDAARYIYDMLRRAAGRPVVHLAIAYVT